MISDNRQPLFIFEALFQKSFKLRGPFLAGPLAMATEHEVILVVHEGCGLAVKVAALFLCRRKRRLT